MRIVSTIAQSQPMLLVSTTASMSGMREVMQSSFAELGRFFAEHGVKPIGPPLAIYHDWSGNQTAVDVGFPVTETDAGKASGEVKRGATPEGAALKIVHTGSYDDLPVTYAALDDAMKQAHLPSSTRMWEVYRGTPGVTPEAELVTEIFSAVSAGDAAKFPGAEP